MTVGVPVGMQSRSNVHMVTVQVHKHSHTTAMCANTAACMAAILKARAQPAHDLYRLSVEP